jgi:hypothetical protein
MAEKTTEEPAKPTFRPRARMLVLLGDQLIRDAGIAVFELVKNAYDADASCCEVTLQNIASPPEPKSSLRTTAPGWTSRL